MNYFIAYKDSFGNDCDGKPWIVPDGGFTDMSLAKRVRDDMINRGFLDVKLFESEYVDDYYDWDFVDDNIIE